MALPKISVSISNTDIPDFIYSVCYFDFGFYNIKRFQKVKLRHHGVVGVKSMLVRQPVTRFACQAINTTVVSPFFPLACMLFDTNIDLV